jgi:photosystem II stability/assembly factor-like uncharacterized protein
VEEYDSRPTTIVHTTDGGQTWGPQSTGIFFPPTRVHATSAEKGWIVWGLGELHPDGHWQRTFDGGASWIPGGSGQDFSRPLRALMDVFFIDENVGWTAGANLFFEFSVDGEPSSSPINKLGGILHTKDGGDTWDAQSVPVPVGVFLTGVYFVDATHGWAVVETGDIIVTQDGGTTWTAQTSGVSTALHGVTFKDASTGWAVGDGGVILHTTDGGTSWETQTSGTTSTLRRVVAPPGGNPWIVGDGGTLLECV